MEEQEESPPASVPPLKQSPLCEECQKNPSKYKCPGCSMRTCSLSCVKAHKQRTACTGKKQFNEVVPLSQFDDNLLLSDYNMLEDVKRVAESVRRKRFKTSHFRLPFPLKSLRSAAASRRTKLLFFSSGMSRREKNRTYYNYRKKYISWTIEWRFHSTDVVLIDHGIHEGRSLYSVIENHLKPGPWKHQLRRFCEEPLDSLKFFIRKYPKGPRSPFRELNIQAPVREQLANLVILEFPIIHVFLPSHSCGFEIIRDIIPCKVEDKASVKSDDLCQKGVAFTEEEIDENGSSDPHVSDLMNSTNVVAEFKTFSQQKVRKRKPRQAFDGRLLKSPSLGSLSNKQDKASDCRDKDNCRYIGCKAESSATCGNIDFDFEQELLDAYKDLIAQTNLDDLLKHDAVLNEGIIVEEEKGYANFSPVEEELEEGEIA